MENIKLICFDLDETLIVQNSWYQLNLSLGLTDEQDKEMYHQFKQGEITYKEWTDRIINLYMKHENATKEGITKALSLYSLAAGSRETVQYFMDKGFIVVLISGSIDILVNMVAKDLGITYAKANNTFIFDEDGRLKGCHTEGDDTLAKARHLEAFCELFALSLTQCACIGDGENDVEMFRKTKHGITFKDSKIKDEAWKVVDDLASVRKIFEK